MARPSFLVQAHATGVQGIIIEKEGSALVEGGENMTATADKVDEFAAAWAWKEIVDYTQEQVVLILKGVKDVEGAPKKLYVACSPRPTCCTCRALHCLQASISTHVLMCPAFFVFPNEENAERHSLLLRQSLPCSSVGR